MLLEHTTPFSEALTNANGFATSQVALSFKSCDTAPAIIFLPELVPNSSNRLHADISPGDGRKGYMYNMYLYMRAPGEMEFTETIILDKTPKSNYVDYTLGDVAPGTEWYMRVEVRTYADDWNNYYYNYTTISIVTTPVYQFAGATPIRGTVTIGGVSKDISGYHVNIGSVWKEVSGGYANIGGTWASSVKTGTLLANVPVGTSVFMDVGGTKQEFIVVQQGLPSSNYDSSCNGTWLMKKDLLTTSSWGSYNDYANSSVQTYLNNTFFNSLDSTIQGFIKSVKIPYVSGKGSSGTLQTGSNGLSTKVFLPSFTELGFGTNTYAKAEGAVLSYFNGVADSVRIANYNGSAGIWWMRSPETSSTNKAWVVTLQGASSRSYQVNSTYYLRPTMVLPSDSVYVDFDMNVIT